MYSILGYMRGATSDMSMESWVAVKELDLSYLGNPIIDYIYIYGTPPPLTYPFGSF